MSDKKIKTCPNCYRKKRNLWSFDEEEICEDCLDLKMFDKILRDELMTDSSVRRVAMEHGVFTERTPNLRVYLATMQAMNFLLSQDLTGSNDVELDSLLKIVQGYTADLEEDVIPVLQKLQLLGDIIEKKEKRVGETKLVKYITSGDVFDEISSRWQGGQKEQALQLLHGLVSSGALSETRFSSGIRDTFVNAIIDDLINLSTGEIDETKGYYETINFVCKECGRTVGYGQKEQLEEHIKNDHIVPEEDVDIYIEPKQQLMAYLVPESQFKKYADRKNMATKSFIDKLYTFVRYKFIFYEKEPTISRDGETYWLIKKEWVKTLKKTKIYVKEHIKVLEKGKGKIKKK